MTEYYKEEDLERFGEIGKYNPELFRKFMAWYNSALEPGILTKREKVLIGLAVAHAVQCPYCIDAYTKSCLEEGMSLDDSIMLIFAEYDTKGYTIHRTPSIVESEILKDTFAKRKAENEVLGQLGINPEA